MKIYSVGVFELPGDGEGYWEPDGWLSDPVERAEWIERHGDARFFWPKTDRVYLSRSSAVRLARLIESYGGEALVYVAEPAWETLEQAKRRRESERRQKRIDRLRAQIATLEEAH